jgi:hypothetical protein
MPVAPTATPAPAPILEPAGDWRSLVASDPGLAQYVGPNEPWAQIERYWQKEIAQRCPPLAAAPSQHEQNP